MYATVLQELLVQQHFMRYNISYKYDSVSISSVTQLMKL